MKLGNDKMCFACGEDNPISLGLKFIKTGEKTAQAEFVPKEVHQGFDGIMHGGLVTTLLDEGMAKVLNLNEIMALTAKLSVRFKKPVSINGNLVIKSEIIKNRAGLYFTKAELRDKKGELLAKAEAKFMEVKEEK